jgi:hypothetical protein
MAPAFQMKRTTEEFNRKTLGLEFQKQANGTSSGLLKIRNWTLWRGQPPLERKRTNCTWRRSW